MGKEYLRNIDFKITRVNQQDNHIIGLAVREKMAIGLFVAHIKNPIGQTVRLISSQVKSSVLCGTRFYSPYGINHISPYESGWKYVELDFATAVFDGDPPFVSIPISRKESITNAINHVSVGSKWKSKNVIWVVRDSTIEKLVNVERKRVWIETEDGRRGQAVYADSIAMKYSLISV